MQLQPFISPVSEPRGGPAFDEGNGFGDCMQTAAPSTGSDYGFKTDKGAVRDLNEDACLAEPDLGLWLVADGMGGHSSGDVASRIVRDTILEHVRDGQCLSEAIKAAHEQLLKEAGQREGSEGMGATVVTVLADGPEYQVAWVGDSRAYLFDGELLQITRDHSYVQDMVMSGAISSEEAGSHPSRHILTRCLGVNPEETFEVGTRRGRFARGQELLLCSDGLTDELSGAEITEILKTEAPAQVRVDRLVEAAVENGGKDNVTVVLFSAPTDAPRGSKWPRKLRLASLGAGIAAAVLAVIFFFRMMGYI